MWALAARAIRACPGAPALPPACSRQGALPGARCGVGEASGGLLNPESACPTGLWHNSGCNAYTQASRVMCHRMVKEALFMRALVLQHVAVEGPGTLASYLDARGWTLETVALYEGAHLPEDAQGYQAVIVMGGPMGVYDEAEYPFLPDEHQFLRRVLAQGVPVLGICLASQLLAKALGARVYRNPH